MNLPELPKPYGWLHDGNGNDPLTFVRGEIPYNLALVCSTMQVMSIVQMRDYGNACAQAAIEQERERCAALCRLIQIDRDARAKAESDEEDRAFLEGESCGAEDCADAIRKPN